MRKLMTLLIITSICAVCVAAGLSGSHTGRYVAARGSLAGQPVAAIKDRAGTIDGSKNPELIPDRTAYSLLFRLISDRQTGAQKDRIRNYIRHMGLGRQTCKSCPKAAGSNEPADDRDIDALVAAADEFYSRVSVLDRQAAEIKAGSHGTPSPEDMSQLAQLQRQKEGIVDEIVASLPGRLSPDALAKTRRHVNEHVKPRVKMDAPAAQ